jgi:hypothetical protein
VAAAEATPVVPTDADTKVEAKESIKPFPTSITVVIFV